MASTFIGFTGPKSAAEDGDTTKTAPIATAMHQAGEARFRHEVEEVMAGMQAGVGQVDMALRKTIAGVQEEFVLERARTAKLMEELERKFSTMDHLVVEESNEAFYLQTCGLQMFALPSLCGKRLRPGCCPSCLM